MMIAHIEDDETGGPAVYWVNPWTGKKEKLANFWWPEHPPEATPEVEQMFASITVGINYEPKR
jgi:hypothetical protein